MSMGLQDLNHSTWKGIKPRVYNRFKTRTSDIKFCFGRSVTSIDILYEHRPAEVKQKAFVPASKKPFCTTIY
jgi:hypothetical protein